MRAIAAMFSTLPKQTNLERVDRRIVRQCARLRLDPVGVDRQHAVDARCVLNSQRPVTTHSGWQPSAATVSRSAWIPAPQVGSLAAKVSTIGGDRWGIDGGMGIRTQSVGKAQRRMALAGLPAGRIHREIMRRSACTKYAVCKTRARRQSALSDLIHELVR